ncbi:MAG: hypothetical protein IT383_18960 [Deltaproteobacteria bacterium]|nr:hypothetical protein [Deltaproteobacteria bacterium]
MSRVRTYLMPIEASTRELDYKLVLAALLASPERRFLLFRQDLGPKLVGPIRGGVWVGQHIKTRTEGKDDYTRLHRMKDAGFAVGFLDEEGAVFHGDEREWAEQLNVRVDPTVLTGDDVICTWGTFQAAAYRGQRPRAEVIPTGHPRFDLCRAPYSSIYEESAGRLRDEFGRYVLVNTNFGLANYITGIAGLFNRRDGYRPENESSRMAFVTNWRRALETFGLIVEGVHRLAARYPKVMFVVRPHPIEDHDAYRRLLAGISNVRVIHRGGVIPWLRSAAVVVHNGCTTAVEAHLAGASVINYVPEAVGDREAWVATMFGRRAASYDVLEEIVGVSTERAIEDDPTDPERLRRAASIIIQLGEQGQDPRRAFSGVVDALERIEKSAGTPRFDDLTVRALAGAHAAGVKTKTLLGEAGSRVGRVQRAPRKFMPFEADDISERVALASRVSGRPLRAHLLSGTVLQVS